MIAADLSYGFPHAAYLFLATFLIVGLWIHLYYYRQSTLGSAFQTKLLERLMVPRSYLNFWGKTYALCLVWILAVAAFMEPQGNMRYPPGQMESRVEVRQLSHEVIFLMDVSASMGIPDGPNGQSRLDYAKDVVDQITASLKGERVSLYAFTSELLKQVPATNDTLFVRLLLKQLQLNEGETEGTDFYNTFNVLFNRDLMSSPTTLKTILVFSDGGDTLFETLKGNAKEERLNSLLNLIKSPDRTRVKVHTIGFGSASGQPVPGVVFEGKPVRSALEKELMEKVAERGEGKFYLANSLSAIDIAASLAKIVNEEQNQGKEPIREESRRGMQQMIYDLYYQYPLGIAIILLGLILFLPDTAIRKRTLSSTPLWIFFLYFTGTSLFGVEPSTGSSELHKAAGYYYAQDYSAAKEIYTQLLNSSLTLRQEAIVRYNLATVLLKEKMWQEAIEQLQELTLIKNLDPLLTYRLYLNLGIAQFNQGINMASTLVDSQEHYHQILLTYYASLLSLRTAKEAYCESQRLQGNTKCIFPNTLLETESSVKLRLSEIQTKRQELFNKETDLPEALLYFGMSLKDLSEELAFLQKGGLSEELHNSYVDLFVQQAETWEPLWTALYNKYHEKIHDAYKFYHVAIRFMEKGRLDLSLEAVKDAQWELGKIVDFYRGKNPPREYFQILYHLYETVLAQEPLQQSSLLSLVKFQRLISQYAYISTTDFAPIQEDLNNASEAFDQGKRELARIFLEEALQELDDLIDASSSKLRKSPKEMLKKAIDAQKHALKMLLYEFKGEDSLAIDLLRHAQKRVSTEAQVFLSRVYSFQEEGFQREGVPGIKDQRCQYHPWNEALPSFIKGNRAAVSAQELFQKTHLDINGIVDLQILVLQDWNKALAALNMPYNSEGCTAPSSSSSDEEPKSQNSQIKDVLTVLQEMEREDRPVSRSAGLPNKVQRPW